MLQCATDHANILTLVVAKTIHLRLLFDAQMEPRCACALEYPFQRISAEWSAGGDRARHSASISRAPATLGVTRPAIRTRFAAPHRAFETSINLSGARREVRGTCQTGIVPGTTRTLPGGGMAARKAI